MAATRIEATPPTSDKTRSPTPLSRALRALDNEAEESRNTRRFDRDRYRIEVANDQASREQAYRLVYEVYLEKGYASPHPSRLWFSPHNALPETTTIIVKSTDDSVVGTLTVIFDSHLGLHADELYGWQLDRMRARGHRLSEIISLAVKPGIEDAQNVLAELFWFAYLVAYRIRNASDFVISVTPRHAGFYKRKLDFKQVGPALAHGKVNGTVGVLLRLDLGYATETNRRAHRGNPMPRSGTLLGAVRPEAEVTRTTEALRESMRAMSGRELAHFLLKRNDVLGRARRADRRYLADRLDAAVCGRELLAC